MADVNVKTMWTAGKAANDARARDRRDELNRGEVVDRWFPPQSDSKVVVQVEDQRRHAE